MGYNKTSNSRLLKKLPAMVKTDAYDPSGTQIRVLCAYLKGLDDKKPKTPPQILRELGKSANNWYQWQRSAEFVEWWNSSLIEYHKHSGLANVYSAMLRRACDNSPQDAKLFLERFDDDYKPATSQEHRFPGLRPPDGDVEAAVERSRKRAEAITQGQELVAEVAAQSNAESVKVGK